MSAENPSRIVRHVAGCEGGPCPNLYEQDNGDFIVQGLEVTDPTVLDGIQVAPGETFVTVPRDLLLAALAKLEIK